LHYRRLRREPPAVTFHVQRVVFGKLPPFLEVLVELRLLQHRTKRRARSILPVVLVLRDQRFTNQLRIIEHHNGCACLPDQGHAAVLLLVGGTHIPRLSLPEVPARAEGIGRRRSRHTVKVLHPRPETEPEQTLRESHDGCPTFSWLR